MMAGNPNWWSNIMHPPSLSFPTQYVLNGSSSSLPLNNNTTNSTSLPDHDRDLNQDPPQSWSQLLLGGMLAGEEERFGLGHFQPKRNPDNWEEQVLINSINSTSFSSSPRVLAHHDHHQHDVFKQEVNSQNGSLYGRVMQNHHEAENIVRVGASSARASPAANNWISSPSMMPSSSPRSCVTSLSSSNTNTNITTNNNNNNNNNNNILDFSYSNQADGKVNQAPDHSPECKSTTAAGACKKPRVQPSSSHPPLKVRKEKLGDRITALHQLVSPFGKTDTASVLLEAIGYIRFLQGQIEALSSPYLSSVSKNMRNQQSGRGERNSVFPEEPGQLLNEARLKRKVDPNLKEDSPYKAKDLRSRGLCLVPVSCTQQVGSDNGADYWAPAYGGDF